METIFANPPDTSMFVPIFLFWSVGGVVFLGVVSILACFFYQAFWLPWTTPDPSDEQIADKLHQLTHEHEQISTLIKKHEVSDQRVLLPLDQAGNYLRQANHLARHSKSKKRQLKALHMGLDEISKAHHWLSWITGPEIPAKKYAGGHTMALDARTEAAWQSQPQRFAVRARVFKRPFTYLDTALADTPPEKMLTFAEANGVAIMWEIDNEGDMAEAIVVDVHTGEVFPLFSPEPI